MRLSLRRRAAQRAAITGCVIAASLLTAASASATTYSWSVSLSGAAQTQSGIPGDPDGTGTANITGNTATNQICATVGWQNIAPPVVAGHVHQALPNQPENPAFTLNLFGPTITGASNPVSACNPAPGPVLDEMAKFPEAFAVVVHNQAFPLGAIRGQLRSGGLTGIECDLKLRCP